MKQKYTDKQGPDFLGSVFSQSESGCVPSSNEKIICTLHQMVSDYNSKLSIRCDDRFKYVRTDIIL